MNNNGTVLQAALIQFGIRVKYVGESISPQLSTYYYDFENIAEYNSTKLNKAIEKLSLYYHKSFNIVKSFKSHFGLSYPNKQISPLWLTNLTQPKDNHSINIGKDLDNNDVILDFNIIPHLLIAGSTGSGKSILLKSIMYSLYTNIDPTKFQLTIIDPKRTEFQMFKQLNNVRYVDETVESIAIIENLVSEMEYRYEQMSQGVSIEEFDHLFVVVDELADLMLSSRYEVEESIVRLAQKARAAKIHLILATQRPTVNVVTGTIKVNMPNRICLKMASQVDSRTMLDTKGAEELLGRGDAILIVDGTTTRRRFQCAMISNWNIEQSIRGN